MVDTTTNMTLASKLDEFTFQSDLTGYNHRNSFDHIDNKNIRYDTC
jgi:hypothetical protein